jgi:hypothetical protein
MRPNYRDIRYFVFSLSYFVFITQYNLTKTSVIDRNCASAFLQIYGALITKSNGCSSK